MRLWVVVVVAALFAIVGPRLTSPRDRAAGAPFVYEPPEGFAPPPPEEARAGQEKAQVWIHAPSDLYGFVPRVTVTHSALRSTVEGEDLSKLASGMPKVFAESGVTWSERRHETRTRADGARVGLLEGDCRKGVGVEVRYRALQLVFPDDSGTSIVTASFPSEDAARWESVFEASIAGARGVAVRVPPPPLWMHLAWGAAGAVLGGLAASLGGRRKPSPEAPRREAETA